MSIVPASASLALPTAPVGGHYYILEKTDSKWYEAIQTGVVDRVTTWVLLFPGEGHMVAKPAVEYDKVLAGGERGGLPRHLVSKVKRLTIVRFARKYTGDEKQVILAEADRMPNRLKAPQKWSPRSGKLGAKPKTHARNQALTHRLAHKTSVPNIPIDDGDRGSVSDAGENANWFDEHDAQMKGSGYSNSSCLALAEPLNDKFEVGTVVDSMILSGTVTGEHCLCLVKGITLRAQRVEFSDRDQWSVDRGAVLRKLWSVAKGTTVAKPADSPDGVPGLLEDTRRFGIINSATGEALGTFHESVALMGVDDTAAFVLTGSRTNRYCQRETVTTGLGPSGRSRQWRHENGISQQDSVGVIHEVLSEIEEIRITRDQLDTSNQACFERLYRHKQFIEEWFRPRLEEKRMSASITDGVSLCAVLFAGRPRRAGGAIECLLLISFVSKCALEDSKILKQQRKALEARKPTPPAKK